MPSIIKSTQFDNIKPAELIIKREPSKIDPPRPQKKAVTHEEIVAEAKYEAKEILKKAENYARATFEEKMAEIDKISVEQKMRSIKDGYAEGKQEGEKVGTKTGYDDGFERGYQEGLRASQEKSEDLMLELELCLSTINQNKDLILERFTNDIESLAVMIARTIIKSEVSFNANNMYNIIEKAMSSYRNKEWIQICVSEHNLEMLTEADNSVVELLKSVSSDVQITSNSDLNDLDCIIDMPDESVDLGIDTQLDNVAEAIKNEFGYHN